MEITNALTPAPSENASQPVPTMASREDSEQRIDQIDVGAETDDSTQGHLANT